MRKYALALTLAAVAVAGVARAAVEPEPIPAELVQQLAPIAVQLLQTQIPEPPVKVDYHVEKALGFHVKEMFGVVGMPDKKLEAATIEKAGETAVPVGVIATRSLSMIEKDKETVIPADRLAVVSFQDMFRLPVFFLAVKGKGDERTLEVYAKNGTPIASAPLKKQAGDAANPLGLKLTNIDTEKKRVDCKISLGGAYEATVRMGGIDL